MEGKPDPVANFFRYDLRIKEAVGGEDLLEPPSVFELKGVVIFGVIGMLRRIGNDMSLIRVKPCCPRV